MFDRRIILSWLAASTLVLVPAATHAQQTRRIELRQVEAMFAQMRASAPWNVDGPLLWGYFFFDSDPEKLKRASLELASRGYRVVGIAELPGRRVSRLHVEKVEVHSPQTLHARNSEFYELAAKFELASYDGMDVGPPPK